jgi:hypothetical protein
MHYSKTKPNNATEPNVRNGLMTKNIAIEIPQHKNALTLREAYMKMESFLPGNVMTAKIKNSLKIE